MITALWILLGSFLAVLSVTVIAVAMGWLPGVRLGREYFSSLVMRCTVWLLMHLLYRLRKSGTENIPEEGAALIVCNHVSYIDALVITAACPRPIRWVMDHRIFRAPVISWLFKTLRAIPIASARDSQPVLDRAYETIDLALSKGELVGIFPEGRLTTTGDINEFKGGVAKVLAKRPVPVIPMGLSGLWRSLFARNCERFKYVPWRLFPRVEIKIGGQLSAAAATPDALFQVVSELRGARK